MMAEGGHNAPSKRIRYSPKDLIKLGRNPASRNPAGQTSRIAPEMPFVTDDGTISLPLHSDITVELTIDHAVKIVNPARDISIAVSSTGLSTSVFHPFGRLYQKGDVAEIRVFDSKRTARYGKITQRGISFSSNKTNIAYLLDSGGAHTTVKSFSDLGVDVSKEVFISESSYGPNFREAAEQMLRTSHILPYSPEKTWVFGPVKIFKNDNGAVRVEHSDLYTVKTSAPKCSALVKTKDIHFTASFNKKHCSHLFARQQDQRIFCGPTEFIARSAGQAAGLDENAEFKLF